MIPRLWPSLLLTALLLFSPAISSCSSDRSTTTPGCSESSSPCLKGTASVELITSRGKVVISLDGKAAPLTAGNFVDLVRRGTYNGTVFHRVVKQPVPFVVQGGDPASADPKTPATQYGLGGFVDPATGNIRQIPLELKRKDEPLPRYGEPVTSPGLTRQIELTHQRGAVAMARSTDPNSASAQFYIALQSLAELDGRYAVFGQVTEGMDVIDAIQQGDRLVRATLLSGGTLVKGSP
ncbi:MAG: peptidylprolyl isomerase [Cyanobacteriota bacterium]|nr:peptidylprolyl isomerase [Cyanobacteriota bacterium]